MKYDVCFVNPPRPELVNPHAQASLGILYLAAECEAAGLDVAVANCAGLSVDVAAARLPMADVYGLSGTFLDVAVVNALSRLLKVRDPMCRVLVGGPIALSADELADEVDQIVAGEADLEIARLCATADTARLVACEAPADLDALSLPARHLWPGPLGGNVFWGGVNYFGGGSTTLLTSRGCPMSCAFCAGPALAPRTVRYRSPERVVDEMERSAIDFGIRQFRLSDEFFTANRAHLSGVCEGIFRSTVLGHGDGLAWRASVGVKPHDVEMWRLMRAAGCREVSFGVESADPHVLEVLEKRQTPADSLAALENARAAGIRTRALLMVGTPGERPETLSHNLVFLRTAPFDGVAVTVFQPIPGCQIAKDPDRYGCRVLAGASSLCVHGPGGRRDLQPSINCLSMSITDLAGQIAITVAAAEATGRLGKG